METDPSKFIAGGYLATREISRPDWLARERVPGRIVTLTEHLCSSIPGCWILDGTGDREALRAKAMLQLGIAPDRRREIRAWCETTIDREWEIPGVGFTSEFAVQSASRWLARDGLSVAIGIGIPRTLVAGFIAATPQPHTTTHLHYGVPAVVRRGHGLDEGGSVLGFDLYPVDEYGLGCSWLCEHLFGEICEDLGLVLNEHGLIGDRDRALAALERLRAAEAKGLTEQGLWCPWLVARYD